MSIALAVVVASASAQQRTLDSTRVVNIVLTDGSELSGRVLSWDSTGLRLRTMDGRGQRIAASLLARVDDSTLAEIALDAARGGAFLETGICVNVLPTGRVLGPNQWWFSLTPLVFRASNDETHTYEAPWKFTGPLYPSLAVGTGGATQVSVSGMYYPRASEEDFFAAAAVKTTLYGNRRWAIAGGLTFIVFRNQGHGTQSSLKGTNGTWVLSGYATYDAAVAVFTIGCGIGPGIGLAGIGMELPFSTSFSLCTDHALERSDNDDGDSMHTLTLRYRVGIVRVDIGAYLPASLDRHDRVMDVVPWLGCAVMF
ncbi:MAG: hypothetical protein IPP94_04380 [Ignavibacteria bacterium]|nr:hypothetical protein [Ignavibacteria bacterium]